MGLFSTERGQRLLESFGIALVAAGVAQKSIGAVALGGFLVYSSFKPIPAGQV